MANAQSLGRVDDGIRARLAAIFADFQDMRNRRRVFKQTLNELRQLSNRDLTDLGIHRAMITRVAHEAAFGK